MAFRTWLCLAGLAAAFSSLAQPPAPATPASPAPAALSSTAERVYDLAKPRILQIRTLLQSAGRQSSLGSGFLVAADGLAVTNYHVVSQYALDPKTYRLEYLAPDGAKFTIIEGTYNGLVDKSYDERIHFSGAINPGMSGGPVAGSDGRIVGVNVAKRLDGEQVGFLVPARFAAELIERARKGPALAVDKAKEEVGRQLDGWQAAFYEALKKEGFRTASYGPYRGLESAAPWVTCWASTNSDQIPKPRTAVNTTRCSSATGIFVSDRILTGRVDLSYAYYKAIDLNAFQFAKELSQRSAGPSYDSRGGKRLTEQQCRDDFVTTAGAQRPPIRATWCMRAYREFEGLYNVTLLVLTQDRNREALLAQLTMQGVSHANAVALGRRFLEAIDWAPGAAPSGTGS